MKEKTMPIEGGKSGLKIDYLITGEKGRNIHNFLNKHIEIAEITNKCKYDQLVILNNSLLNTFTGKWKIGEPNIKCVDRDKKIVHARTFEEAVKGVYASKTGYNGWSERYFSREDMGHTPTSEENAVDQIRVLDWWLGNSQGDPQPAIQQLLAVRDTHKQDFVEQLSTSFILAGDSRRNEMIEKMKGIGWRIDAIPVEELTIKLESMFLPKELMRPAIIHRASLRISATVGKRAFLNLFQEGLPPYQFELTDEKTPLAALPRILGNVVDLSQSRRK